MYKLDDALLFTYQQCNEVHSLLNNIKKEEVIVQVENSHSNFNDTSDDASFTSPTLKKQQVCYTTINIDD